MNHEPEHLANTAPKMTKAKAYVSTGLTMLTVFLTAWITDSGSFTGKEMAAAFMEALVSGGIVGTGTYFTKNQVKS